MTVEWTVPSNTGPEVDDYNIQYATANNGPWNDATHAGTGTSLTLEELLPNITYHLPGAGPTTTRGWGNWSDTASAVTRVNAPPEFQDTGDTSERSLGGELSREHRRGRPR